MNRLWWTLTGLWLLASSGCASTQHAERAHETEQFLRGVWRLDLPASPPLWIPHDLLPHDTKHYTPPRPQAIWMAFVPPRTHEDPDSNRRSGALVVLYSADGETRCHVSSYHVRLEGTATELTLARSRPMLLRASDTSDALILQDPGGVEVELLPVFDHDLTPLTWAGSQHDRSTPATLRPH